MSITIRTGLFINGRLPEFIPAAVRVPTIWLSGGGTAVHAAA
jgi:hypothetical protein